MVLDFLSEIKVSAGLCSLWSLSSLWWWQPSVFLVLWPQSLRQWSPSPFVDSMALAGLGLRLWSPSEGNADQLWVLLHDWHSLYCRDGAPLTAAWYSSPLLRAFLCVLPVGGFREPQ